MKCAAFVTPNSTKLTVRKVESQSESATSLLDSGVQAQWHSSLDLYVRMWVRACKQATFPSDSNIYIDVSLGDRACLCTRTWVRAYKPSDKRHLACTLESLVYLAKTSSWLSGNDYRVPNAGTSVQAQWHLSLGLHTERRYERTSPVTNVTGLAHQNHQLTIG